MGLIDFILNLAGLLLWLNWCATRFDPLARPTAKTLAGTLRRAGPAGLRGGLLLGGLGALVLARAFLYWQIGPALHWTPTLDLAAVVLHFRSGFFLPTLLFSLLSFLCLLVVFYTWLLFLVILNRTVGSEEPVQKLIRLHLGPVARWPRPVQWLLPLLVAGALWLAFHPLLIYCDIAARTATNTRLALQAALVGAGTYLPLRFLITFLLLAYLLNSYVYLGRHSAWNFLNATARNLLAPLRRVPLRVGKVDFAPVVGIVLVFLLAEIALHWLPKVFLT